MRRIGRSFEFIFLIFARYCLGTRFCLSTRVLYASRVIESSLRLWQSHCVEYLYTSHSATDIVWMRLGSQIVSRNLTQWQDPDPIPLFKDAEKMTKGESGPTVDSTVWILGWTQHTNSKNNVVLVVNRSREQV